MKLTVCHVPRQPVQLLRPGQRDQPRLSPHLARLLRQHLQWNDQSGVLLIATDDPFTALTFPPAQTTSQEYLVFRDLVN